MLLLEADLITNDFWKSLKCSFVTEEDGPDLSQFGLNPCKALISGGHVRNELGLVVDESRERLFQVSVSS